MRILGTTRSSSLFPSSNNQVAPLSSSSSMPPAGNDVLQLVVVPPLDAPRARDSGMLHSEASGLNNQPSTSNLQASDTMEKTTSKQTELARNGAETCGEDGKFALESSGASDVWVVPKSFLSMEVVFTMFGVSLIIWAFGWLYCGAFWDPTTRITNLHVGVLDCDAGLQQSALPATLRTGPYLAAVSPVLRQPLATSLLAGSVFNASSPASEIFYWVNFTCNGGCNAPDCRDQMISWLDDAHGWAMLYFPQDFTANVLSWTDVPGAEPQRPTVELLYGRGRSYSTYSYLLTVMTSYLNELSISLGLQLSTPLPPALLSAFNLPTTGSSRFLPLMPAFFAQSIKVVTIDLHPVRHFGQNFASYVFCMLAWLAATFSVGVSNQYKLPCEVECLNTPHNKRSPEQRRRLLKGLMREFAIKAACLALFTFVVACMLVGLVGALGHTTRNSASGYAQFSGHNAGYCIAFLWYLSWSMISLNVVLVHTMGVERFGSMSAILLALQLVSSGAIMSEELSNPFFYIGKAFPWYYGVRGFRTIFFGGQQNLMAFNWGILTIYNVGLGVLANLYALYRMWYRGYERRPPLQQAPGRGGSSEGESGAGAVVARGVMPATLFV